MPGTVFVLDSSAVVRFLDKEAGWNRVAAILEAHRDQTAEAVISAVQWGEIAGVVRKKRGAAGQKTILDDLSLFQLRIVAATAERAVRAAEIKQDWQIPYADAFALELAMDSADHLLVTADYDFKAVADLARVEFLPLK
jgi:predicted nucleic acid-binding protein